jgi:hypothetical protein
MIRGSKLLSELNQAGNQRAAPTIHFVLFVVPLKHRGHHQRQPEIRTGWRSNEEPRIERIKRMSNFANRPIRFIRMIRGSKLLSELNWASSGVSTEISNT